MIDTVLLITPFQCQPVQIGDVAEYPVCQEVFFYKANESLDFSFCERMSWLAELCAISDDLPDRDE